MRLKFLFFFLLILLSYGSCKENTPAQNETVITSKQDSVETANKDSELPVHCDTSSGIKGTTYSPVLWNFNETALIPEEKNIPGQWIAAVNDISIKTGGVMFNLNKKENSSDDLIKRIMESLDKKNYAKRNCLWLHFYKDHTGFYSACAEVEDSHRELLALDVFDGKSKPMGLKFNWYYEKGVIRIQFEDCVKVPYIKNKQYLGDLKVRYWDLTITKKYNKGQGYIVKEFFPEYKYTLPLQNDYMYDPSEEDQISDYKKAMLD